MTGYIVGAIVAALEFAILCVWVYLCRHYEEIDFLKALSASFFLVFGALVGFAVINSIPGLFLFVLYSWNHAAGVIGITAYGLVWIIALVACRGEIKDMFRREDRKRIMKALSLDNDDIRTCWK